MLPLHHDPRKESGVCVSNAIDSSLFSLLNCCVVALRVELSATRLSAEFGPSGPRLPIVVNVVACCSVVFR
jgi:hypothetical protein